jgi:hypothetical protein
MKRPSENFQDILSPGLAGWVDFIESDAIPDNASPEVNNVVYDGGFVSPRPGSRLFAAKPPTSKKPLQLIESKSSDGLEYIIGVYENDFFLYHPEVEDWQKINHTFTPAETDLYYGYISWNNGRGQDRMYACNGVDSFVKWHMATTTVDGDQADSVTTVNVVDATRFPASGTVVFKVNGNEFTWAYTSKTATTLVGGGATGTALVDGDAVTMMLVEVSGMQKGKVLGKHGGRLFTMNRFGAEIAGYYSQLNNPEGFAGTGISASSSFVISDGNGEITGFEDYGRFAVILKEDSVHTFEIIISEDLGAKLDKIQPVISGTSIGPLSQPATIKLRNRIMYPTSTEGIMSLDPLTSGDSTGSAINVISQNIQTYVTEGISFTTCRASSYRQHALWAVSDPKGSGNIEVLVFDMLRNAWSKFTGWAVKDWARFNDRIFYMENGSGEIYEGFVSSFDDNNNPIEVDLYTKRFNFGSIARPKVNDLVYVQGYLTPSTELFVDVLFNEGGLLNTQTFKIEQGANGVLVSQPLTDALGQGTLGTVALGYIRSSQIGDVAFFRTYLGVDISKGYYNMQLRFRSNKATWWAVTGISFNPRVNVATDSNMVLSPE